jgi:hypothetical protein
VELTGRAASQEDLEGRIEEIMGLDGVLEVDTTDVTSTKPGFCITRG